MSDVENPFQIESKMEDQSPNTSPEDAIWSRIAHMEEILLSLRNDRSSAPLRYGRTINDLEEQIRRINLKDQADDRMLNRAWRLAEELRQEQAKINLSIKRRERKAVKMYEANVLATAASILTEKQHQHRTSDIEDGGSYIGRPCVDIEAVFERDELGKNFGLTNQHQKALIKWMGSSEQHARDAYFNETQAQFAEWLIYEHFYDEYFEFWNPLFRFCYRKTIEEFFTEAEVLGSFLDNIPDSSEE